MAYVGVSGAAGKMGRTLIQMINSRSWHHDNMTSDHGALDALFRDSQYCLAPV